MNRLILLIGFLVNVFFSAQIAIGKNTVNAHSILEFGTDPKGIVLPIATIDVNEAYANGTILMDRLDNKVKIMQDGLWLELSDTGSISVQVDTDTNPLTTARSLIAVANQEIGDGVVIGNKTTAQNNNVKGVLVLEDSAKALVLPMVENPHLNIKMPTAGTMCYDTASDSLAVFDGKVWNYWK